MRKSNSKRIQYAKTKPDIVAKADAERKRREQHDANQGGMDVNSAYAGAYGASPVSMLPKRVQMQGLKSQVKKANDLPSAVNVVQLPKQWTVTCYIGCLASRYFGKEALHRSPGL
uniref:Uncharacterized protein n=1 Tax=Nelumbo nucifera TaxID=4432 RepID=A0A822YL79_NELNU|nr:TPA_asm: hypothetical protein HUJ06_012123 [Nelumbo nucifera]